MRCGVPASHVRNVIIWGNHSSTQYPDVHHCVVNMSGSELACFDAVKDDAWLKGDFITVSARKFTTICRTMRDSFSFIVCFPVSHLKIKHRNIENCFFFPQTSNHLLSSPAPTPLSVSVFLCKGPCSFTTDSAAERCCSHQGQEVVQRHVCSQSYL